jgi:putative ABC transport system permease protein
VLLGQTVADNLFGPGADPVGETVRIRNMPFTIVGVLNKKGQSGTGQDLDDAVFMPATTFQRNIQGRFGKFISGQIFIGAADAESTTQAENDIRDLMRQRHRIEIDGRDDFDVRNMAEMANARAESTKTMTALLAGIALVSLVVGGIGVMNIMLVSVTERTREIGTRMAVGARGRDILAQFLAESVMLALVGGAIGIAIGIGTALLLSKHFGWPLAIRLDIVLLAAGVSAVVGIGFGLYPARKASQLDPIDALRYE